MILEMIHHHHHFQPFIIDKTVASIKKYINAFIIENFIKIIFITTR